MPMGSSWRVKRHDVLARVYAMYRDGVPVIGIARAIGKARGLVYSCLRDLGLPARDMREAQRLRYAGTSDAERCSQTLAAHAAVRGKKRSEKVLAMQAMSRQAAMVRVGAFESDLALDLASWAPVQQFAIGPFNIDVMVWPLAIEVHTQRCHPHGSPRIRRRIRYLLDLGVSPCYLCVHTRDGEVPSAEALIAIQCLIRKTQRGNAATYYLMRADGSHTTPKLAEAPAPT